MALGASGLGAGRSTMRAGEGGLTGFGAGAPEPASAAGGAETSLERILHYLLTCALAQAPAPHGFARWWKGSPKRFSPWQEPVDLALAAGFLAPSLGYAFGAGYQAALRALAPSLPLDCVASISVTEEGGAHPRAIRAKLEPASEPSRGTLWEMSGKKRWATLGAEADKIFVAASMGSDFAGKNKIALVALDPTAPGVGIITMPPTPFTPEIVHAELLLDKVSVREDQLLPGDGYQNYVKPFRTIEDVHVSAAVVGYLIGVMRKIEGPSELAEELIGLVPALRSLSFGDPSRVEVHLALAGFWHLQARVLEELGPHWKRTDPAGFANWERDRMLFQVAAGARAKRRARAWELIRKKARDTGAG